VSAMASKPDWLLTHNTKHFMEAVAERTTLRIATLAEFFPALSTLLGETQDLDCAPHPSVPAFRLSPNHPPHISSINPSDTPEFLR